MSLARPAPALAAGMHDTKRRLLEAGVALLLERGYGATGVQELLKRTGIPKGSFYHHFESKEDMALQAVELYTELGHSLLDRCLGSYDRTPLDRLRLFFDQLAGFYESQGYLGCLLGALGQELSGANEAFRRKIEDCLQSLSARIAGCLDEACRAGELPPGTDTAAIADLLLNTWEGAALRSRLQRDPAPLAAALDFVLGVLTAR